MKGIFFSVFLLLLGGSFVATSTRFRKIEKPSEKNSIRAEDDTRTRLQSKIAILKNYALSHNFSSRYIFLVDMKLHSGKKRFFIYDLQKDSVVEKGLVAHGSCNSSFLETAEFSDEPGCGCSAKGKYRIGYSYHGRFGKAFKLFGLDPTNKSAYDRYIVLHSYSCVPDSEVYPGSICNSLGCAMVSPTFLEKAATYIEGSSRPVLLYIFQ